MFGLIKKIFIGLLNSLVNRSNHTKYSQEFHYYPFAAKLDRFVGSCNTLNDLTNKLCIPNKTEELNLSVFNMIRGINESKTLTKHKSCECKCKFDGTKCNSNQRWNNHKCQCESKNIIYVKKIMLWIVLHVIVAMTNI